MIIKIIITIVSVYILFVQLTSYFGYKFCKKDKSSKECRNLTCKYAKECNRNTLYHNDKRK